MVADGVRGRLAVMMALVYAVQGAWWPLLAIHLRDLGIDGRSRGWMFATLALASIATPLGAGQVADRWMATQRVLALVYAAGSGLLAWVALGVTTSVGGLFALLLAFWLLVAPGYGLCNALAFRNLPRAAEQFGGVRLWGTVGWMAAGWLVSGAMAAFVPRGGGPPTLVAFFLGALLAAGFGAYCLTLPNTPPLARGRPVDLGALGELFRRPAVAVFLIAAFGVSLTTPFVYQVVPPYLTALGLPRRWVAMAMTLGQVSEIGMLAALPIFLRRIGLRGTLAVGIGAWVLYHGTMAARPPLVLGLAAVSLNGVAIALFHIAGPLFLDQQAPADRRASVQGAYLLLTSGLGSLLGNLLAGEIVGRSGQVQPSAFLAPCGLALGMLALLLVAFRPEVVAEKRRGPGRRSGSEPRPGPLGVATAGDDQVSSVVPSGLA